MFLLVKFIRTYIGGKTELGLLVSTAAILVYVLPVFSAFDFETLTATLTITGIITGTAFLSRIEDKRALLDAFKSLFSVLRKK